jgi:hypothetical protein
MVNIQVGVLDYKRETMLEGLGGMYGRVSSRGPFPFPPPQVRVLAGTPKELL